MSDAPTTPPGTPNDTPACAECGYDLTGIGGACPECGYAVASSLASGDLTWASPRWLWRVRLGLWLLVLGIGVGLVYPLVSLVGLLDDLISGEFAHTWVDIVIARIYDLPGPLISGSAAVLYFAGCVFATRPEPGRRRVSRARAWVVPLACVGLAGELAPLVLTDRWVDDGAVAQGVLTALSILYLLTETATILLLAWYITAVVRRTPASRGARQPRLSAVVYAGVSTPLFLVYWLLPYVGAVHDFVFDNWALSLTVTQTLMIGTAAWLAIALLGSARRLGDARGRLTLIPPGTVARS